VITEAEKANLLRNANRYSRRARTEGIPMGDKWNAINAVAMCMREMRRNKLVCDVDDDGVYSYKEGE